MSEFLNKLNWFPGHMAKALKEMSEEVKNVDMVIYVLDARAPKSSINPEFIGIIGSKPILYILNKADMVLPEDLSKFKANFKSDNSYVLELNSTKTGAIKMIEPIMTNLCREKIEKNRAKGFNTRLRAMVIGIPNSGKSTLINNLCGKKKTITGNKAGVTKGKQWLTLGNGFEVLDTPGTLYPKITNNKTAINLAMIGSIRNEVIDMPELAIDFINFCKSTNFGILSYYNVTDKSLSNLEILEQIAEHKNFLLKRGELDYDKTAFAIIDDFRKGKLGKIILDN